MYLTSRVLPSKTFALAAYRAVSTLGWHPTGSHALDALSAGGYPGGTIVELHASDPDPCWLVAWLAAAEAQRQGGNVLACGSRAFTDFGKEAGVNLSSKQLSVLASLSPDLLGKAVRTFRPVCRLVLVESLAGMAEAAAPAGPEPATTRALRSRYLGRLMRQMALALQAPPPPPRLRRLVSEPRERERPLVVGARTRGGKRGAKAKAAAAVGAEHEELEGHGDGADGAAPAAPFPPSMSVIICNPRSGPPGTCDSILQQYASMRLQLVAEAGDAVRAGGEGEQALHAPPSIAVQMLKGPGINSRMRPPATQLFLQSSATGSVFGAAAAAPYMEDGAAGLLDLVAAAEQLGLLRGALHAEDGHSQRHNIGRADTEGLLCYGDCEAELLLEFASKLVSAGLVPELRRDVHAALQGLREEDNAGGEG